MNAYVKDVLLNLKINDEFIRDLGSALDKGAREAQSSSDAKKRNQEQNQNQQNQNKFVDNFKKSMETFKSVTYGFNDDLDSLMGTAMKFISGDFIGGLNAVITSMKTAADKNVKAAEDLASTADISNSEVRDIMMTYGFDENTAAAYLHAQDKLGLTEEDMMWLTPEKAQDFMSIFENYRTGLIGADEEGILDQAREFEALTIMKDDINTFKNLASFGFDKSLSGLSNDITLGLTDLKAYITNPEYAQKLNENVQKIAEAYGIDSLKTPTAYGTAPSGRYGSQYGGITSTGDFNRGRYGITSQGAAIYNITYHNDEIEHKSFQNSAIVNGLTN